VLFFFFKKKKPESQKKVKTQIQKKLGRLSIIAALKDNIYMNAENELLFLIMT
jgi:hypothetical protein